MKKNTMYIIGIIVLLSALTAWLLTNKKKAEDKVYRPDRDAEIQVTADTVSLKDVPVNKTYSGVFEPYREVKVMADISGKVIRMNADLGDHLKTGDPIAQLDNALLLLQLEGIRVQISGLEKDVNRYKVLVNENAIQAVQLEKTELALQSALVQEKTLLEQIRKTTIQAPFSGIVTQKFAEIGSVANMSMPLVQLTDIRTVKLNLNVPESDIGYFHLGQSLVVGNDVYPEKTGKGEVIVVGSRGDASHNYQVQVRVSNTGDTILRAGMFGWVTVSREQLRSLPTIPTKALFGSSLQPKVYVISQGRVTEKPIEIALQTPEFTMVSSGLVSGEIVVTSGFINLKNGSRVHVQ